MRQVRQLVSERVNRSLDLFKTGFLAIVKQAESFDAVGSQALRPFLESFVGSQALCREPLVHDGKSMLQVLSWALSVFDTIGKVSASSKLDWDTLKFDELAIHFTEMTAFAEIGGSPFTNVFAQGDIDVINIFLEGQRCREEVGPLKSKVVAHVFNVVKDWKSNDIGSLTEVLAMADSLKDSRLHRQIMWINEMQQLTTAVSCVTDAWAAANSREAKRISDVWVQCLQPLRQTESIMKGY
jgi:hypothetical protein